jgi:hypothetical protein
LTEPCEGGVRWRWDARLRTRSGLSLDGATLTPETYRDMLASIAAPVILVNGDGSRLGGEAAVEWPGAKRVVLAGGHNLQFEAPGMLADLIAECVPAC